MNSYEIRELREAYQAAYQRRLEQNYQLAGSPLPWPSGIGQSYMREDALLLEETIQLPARSQYDDLATQIFGNQLREKKFSLKHLVNLLGERARVYTHNLADINHRHLEIQMLMAKARFASPYEASREQVALERVLAQLEGDKRKERTDFWKDSKDIREAMFEKAMEYQASRNRAQMLSAFGGSDDKV